MIEEQIQYKTERGAVLCVGVENLGEPNFLFFVNFPYFQLSHKLT